MAAPTPVGTPATYGDGVTGRTDHTITLPADIQAGDGIFVACSIGDAAAASVGSGSSAGWLLTGQSATSGANGALAGFVLPSALGGGADVLVVTLATAKKLTAVSQRITGHRTDVLPNLSLFAEGSDQFPNPPNLNFIGGAQDMLVFAVTANNAACTTDAAPAGYSGLVSVQGLAAADGQDGVAMAYKTVNAASEDPGTFTLSASRAWRTATVGFRGLEAAGIIGSMAAVESGADTATGTGIVALSGTLTASESGTDSCAGTGQLQITGSQSAQESGADSATGTGGIRITAASVAISETGNDGATATAQIRISGTAAIQENGGDTAAFTAYLADPPLVASLLVQETGTDTASFLGSLEPLVETIVVALLAVESGSDSVQSMGKLLNKAALKGQESGRDTAQIITIYLDPVFMYVEAEGHWRDWSGIGAWVELAQTGHWSAYQAEGQIR